MDGTKYVQFTHLLISFFMVASPIRRVDGVLTLGDVIPKNLHEDTNKETELANIACTGNVAGDNTCPLCNIVTSNPGPAPFQVWKKPPNTDYRLYYVAGAAGGGLDFKKAPTYFITITCTDTDGATDTKTTEVDILPNQPPVVGNWPGVVKTFDANAPVGAGTSVYDMTATDAEANPISYTMSTEPTVDCFAISADGKITTSKDLRSTAVSPILIKVNVNDGSNVVGPFTVTVNINNLNDRPQVDNLPTTVTLKEDEVGGTVLTTLIVSDVNPGVTTTPVCTVSPPSEAYKFTLNDPTLELRLSTLAAGQKLLDAEKTKKYTITCETSDGFLESAGEVLTLNVLNVNEPPEFNSNLYHCTLYESAALVSSCDLPLVITDPEGDPIAKTFLFSENNGNRFSYDTIKKTMTFSVNYDVDSAAMPTNALLTIASVDTQAKTGTSKIQVTIVDKNDNTPSFAASVTVFTVTQTSSIGLIGKVTADDADLTSPNKDVTYKVVGSSPASSLSYVTVLGNGEVRYAKQLDPVLKEVSYFVYVEAKDGGSPARSSTGTVIVTFMTTVSTTTTESPGFFAYPGNVAMFSIFMIVLALALLAALFCLYNCCKTGYCFGHRPHWNCCVPRRQVLVRPTARPPPGYPPAYEYVDHTPRRGKPPGYDDIARVDQPAILSAAHLSNNSPRNIALARVTSPKSAAEFNNSPLKKVDSVEPSGRATASTIVRAANRAAPLQF